LTKEKACYKAIRRAVAAINSTATPREKLDTLIRATARSLASGASLMLLDSTRKKLIHTSSWGLPQFYLRKGVLDADKSLSEVIGGQPVIANDSRIQYPEIAVQASIRSILGVPVMSGISAIGSIRVYVKEPHAFTNQDISFVSTMANLVSIALEYRPQGDENEAGVSPLREARSVSFANPSEEEVRPKLCREAQLLDV
jgi:signal transduction protein with GAF and PtsI domain